jgi:hypothetical protein
MDMRRHLKRWLNDAALMRMDNVFEGDIAAVREEIVRNRNSGQREQQPVIVFDDGHGKRSGAVYVCATHRRKGSAVCPNSLALSIAEVEACVLDMIEGEVLAPEFIEKILSTLPRTENDRERLEAEIETRSAEVVNLTKAIAAGGDIPELVAALKVASRRLADSKRLLDVSTQETPREELRAALEQRVEDWREKLRAHPAQARQIVSKIIGPIHLSNYAGFADFIEGSGPRGRGKENIEPTDIAWTAEVRLAGLLAGLQLVQPLASPPGFEPGFQP